MSGEVTDFKNTEYKKLRVFPSVEDIALLNRLFDQGWDVEADDEYRAWTSGHGENRAYILTLSRPRASE